MSVKNFFSSFSVKLYTALLLVGVVPLLATVILSNNITTFNENLQQQAYQSIEDVSEIYKVWAKTEAHNIQNEKLLATEYLQRALFEAAIEQKNMSIGEKDLAENAAFKTSLQKILDTPYTELVSNSSLIRIDILYQDNIILTYKQENPLETQFKIKTATNTISTRLIPSEAPQIVLKLTFGINQKYTEKYETLGQKRQIHKGLNTLGGTSEGSITDVYRTFYYVVSLIVIALTIGFTLIIVVPLNKRISKLTAATKKVAQGDLSVKLKTGTDELGNLAARFNQMVKDIKSAQESRAYIERMKAWQEVARRLAHELKNPLTPILLAVQQLDKKFDDYQERPAKYRKLLDDAVDIVNEETNTLKKLVKNFSEFARLPIPEMKTTCLKEFLSLFIQSNPQFQENAQTTLLPVPAECEKTCASLDPELMRRVFVNLVRNGMEAAQNAGISPIIEISISKLAKDSKILISIRDNGPGLTAEQQEKVFQPYFTTKSDGTGLGLSIVRKIITDHSGEINIFNRKDQQQGAQVDIILPESSNNE